MKKIPKYLQIVHSIREKIDRGEWVIGTKIPTQREIAEQFQVNRSTVITAIDILKSEGFLESITGSGIYVINNQWSMISCGSPPDWNEWTQWAMQPSSKETVQLINELETRNDFIQLSKGELGPELYPQKAIEESLVRVSGQLQNYGYGDGLGDRGLRMEISKHLRTYGIPVAPQNILIVSGALQALKLISTGILKKGSIVFFWKILPIFILLIYSGPKKCQLNPLPSIRKGIIWRTCTNPIFPKVLPLCM